MSYFHDLPKGKESNEQLNGRSFMIDSTCNEILTIVYKRNRHKLFPQASQALLLIKPFSIFFLSVKYTILCMMKIYAKIYHDFLCSCCLNKV